MNYSNRILVIDDNPDIHADFRKVLCPELGGNDELDALEVMVLGDVVKRKEEQAFDLCHANQGEEGFNLFRKAKEEDDPFFVAFIDMRMPPGWDGLKTIKAIRGIDEDTTIVICTAYSDHSWEDIAKECKSIDKLMILKKPFDSVELTSLAKSLHERWALQKQADIRTEELQRLVQLRTSELEAELAKDKVRMDQLESIVANRTADLRKLAFTDTLTGLPNRIEFYDRLVGTMAKHKSDPSHEYAVLFLDFDGFKTVNDSLGHEAGDLLLQEIGVRLTSVVNDSGMITRNAGQMALAARLGGDEFCLLLNGYKSEDEVMALVEKLRHELGQPYDLQGNIVKSTASIGITFSRFKYETAEEVLRDADTAMYSAKVRGRGLAVIFEQTMHESVKLRLVLENDLHHALKKQQLEVWYQPIVSLTSQSAVGAEALIRWMHPERGMISPMDFIPIAEETGLIREIGAWVFEQVCKQVTFHPQLNYMSFNVSRHQFADPMFINTFDRILAQTGADPERLVAEVTETALNQDPELAIRCISELRERGIRVFLDDFGTGMSTLGALRNLTIDGIKLDRSFLDRSVFSRRTAAIIDSAATLARDLDMTLIVEGVESIEQVALLQSLHCETAQGYLFSRPVSEEDFGTVIKIPTLAPFHAAA
ncbi:MAG: EAL domain-containing protein [Phycisphaeraceae bacterium]